MKKILIQSSSDEASTDCVLDWLFHIAPECSVTRLNDLCRPVSVYYELTNNQEQFCLNTDDQVLEISDFSGYWYRRGTIDFSSLFDNTLYSKLGTGGNRYLLREADVIRGLFDQSLGGRSLNNEPDNYTNKLSNLLKAKEAGLKIPESLICSRWDAVIEFIADKEAIILKPMVFGGFVVEGSDDKIVISSGVTKLTKQDVADLRSNFKSDQFAPSFFQNYIEKRLEIRIFFLNGVCYSMAIFSQENEKTKVDFRNYDYQRPNRLVPFCLPKEIESRIAHLMRMIPLTSGSIDMILTPGHEFVFLEVNPIGQYQWLTNNCNYFTDRVIAKHLLNEVKGTP